jgi:hypothetical protein
LDPNPKTRITVPEILDNEWFKKGYKPPKFNEEEDVNLDDVDAVFNDSEEHLVTEKKKETTPEVMNAFELISMSRVSILAISLKWTWVWLSEKRGLHLNALQTR